MSADKTRDRLARCRDLLAGLRLDAFVVSDLADVRYLSGFRGEDATLVVGRDVALIVTDSRYYEQVHEEVAAFELVKRAGSDLFADTATAAAERIGAGCTLGYQAGALTHAAYRSLRRAHDGRLKDLRQRVSRLRIVKEAAEIEAVRAAAAIVDLSLAVVAGEGLVGCRECDVAWRLLEEYRDRGAEGEAFPAIVATGDHGAQGHAIPGERVIKAGELVVIDTGARVDGYCSDITRTFAAGRATKEHRRLYDIVLAAQLAGLAAVRPGAHGRDDVDAAARAVIAAAGYGEQFGHGTGHGVGLEVHEAPGLGRMAGDRLSPGMVCTVEPGIYLEGDAGIRIEDTVVVTDGGCERLTLYPKELQVVG
jgi:Xaa-Pro aminopeptidase